MARPGLQSHPKFRRLVYVLGVPVPHALGYLECLWTVAYDRGSASIGDSVDVELAAQWPGEKGVLAKALASCGFIDEIDGQFHIHDLAENAPEYVKKRLARESERKLASRNRKTSAEWRKTADTDRRTADNGVQCPPNGAERQTLAELGEPPIAAHSSTEQREDNTSSTRSTASVPRKVKKTFPEGFETFWEAYPKKVAKADALKVWEKLKPDDDLLRQISDALSWQTKSELWQIKKYIPNPDKWLRGRRWEDEIIPIAEEKKRETTEEMVDRLYKQQQEKNNVP